MRPEDGELGKFGITVGYDVCLIVFVLPCSVREGWLVQVQQGRVGNQEEEAGVEDGGRAAEGSRDLSRRGQGKGDRQREGGRASSALSSLRKFL